MASNLKSYKINSFYKIGLPDPFENDTEMISQEEDIQWHNEVMEDL